jgi:ubiquinone/menaquinone biosynthesis C-methylase UbiE
MADRPANFDSIARPYRWLEYLSFGPYLERCRLHFLSQLTTHRRALILGDGDGRFTARLLAANPQITVDAVDSSGAMLSLLSERVSRLGLNARKRLNVVHTDALAFTPEGPPYDLIVTHFFLDCLLDAQVANLLMQIRPNLVPGAIWLVSEFAVPQHQPAAALSRLVITALYQAFRIFTGLKTQRLPNYASIFRQNGFSSVDRRTFLGGLLVAEIWRLDGLDGYL